ncbi:acetoacetate--CoA ligase [Arthrobacter sp. EH-1B-1]|uniref:Acetoacetate--CoA ligase n=1 Tax=Arthrobacter vasquezii TaxID=2977629 RepID=A0ABT6CV11_9MICC|nr:acetoacetate--CoA ligase [Arthrobacter vasquezii]MDF9277915.1 acetoacetate--CoA ligase [Arthrobacter vasquezii]
MITDAHAADGEVIWQPEPEGSAETGVGRFAAFLDRQGIDVGTGYNELWQWSVDEPEQFWELFARFAGIEFGGTEGPVCTAEPMPHTRWFPGRTLNFARHLLQGHEGNALIVLSEDGTREVITWDTLRREVASLAEHLRSRGVGQGDRVVAILPNVTEAVIGLLASASIGAIWSICAPEFGPGAIVSRFAQLGPKVVIAAPGYMLGGKDRDRRGELGEIFAQLPTLEHVIWVKRHTSVPSIPTPVPAIDWAQAVVEPAELAFADVEFSHPLWVLFSSGTTGVPKGIVHGHGGALLEEMKMLLIHSDLRPGDRYLNVASTSWVLWNSLISALAVGATAVLVDGNPTFPSLDRVWQIAAAEYVTVLGVGAGFVHSCAKSGLVPKNDHNLGALKSLQVTGSPLSADGYRWVYGNVGDIWLSSMSGGTDIASIFVGGSPTLPVHVGYIQAPALGVRVESWDDAGNPTRGKGELVVTKAMPSMPLSFWGDDGSRYHESYFAMYPGVWRHGDYIEFTHQGILIHGRSDSTLNRNGLRLGSADIYTVVEALPEVTEALVVGAELGTDYYMPLFVHLAEGANAEVAQESITRSIRENLSVRYLPDEIIFMPGIPHTRTGKKLEVPIKRLLQGAQLETVADLGSVDDPALLAEYARFALERQTVSP